MLSETRRNQTQIEMKRYHKQFFFFFYFHIKSLKLTNKQDPIYPKGSNKHPQRTQNQQTKTFGARFLFETNDPFFFGPLGFCQGAGEKFPLALLPSEFLPLWSPLWELTLLRARFGPVKAAKPVESPLGGCRVFLLIG